MGSNGVIPFEGFREHIPFYEPFDFRGLWQKAPGLRTEHRIGGLFCFVILICFAVVELVIESLGSSTPAYRHSVVQSKSLWDPVEAEAVLQPCEVRET